VDRNNFLIALFSRPAWFHCKACKRVKVAETEEAATAAPGTDFWTAGYVIEVSGSFNEKENSFRRTVLPDCGSELSRELALAYSEPTHHAWHVDILWHLESRRAIHTLLDQDV